MWILRLKGLKLKEYILISVFCNTELWSLSSDQHKGPSIFNLGPVVF